MLLLQQQISYFTAIYGKPLAIQKYLYLCYWFHRVLLLSKRATSSQSQPLLVSVKMNAVIDIIKVWNDVIHRQLIRSRKEVTFEYRRLISVNLLEMLNGQKFDEGSKLTCVNCIVSSDGQAPFRERTSGIPFANMTWINNYINYQKWNVFTHPFTNVIQLNRRWSYAKDEKSHCILLHRCNFISMP